MNRNSLAQRNLGKARRQAYHIFPAAKAKLDKAQDEQLAQMASQLPSQEQIATVEQLMAAKMEHELQQLAEDAMRGTLP